MTHWPEPFSAEHELATLRPLDPSHLDGLVEAVRDGDLHRLWYTNIPSPDRMKAEIDRRLDLQARGEMLPFTLFGSTGKIAGMTTYMNLDAVNKRLEIGATWTAKSAQRSGLNTACKLLLLTHAFERLDCIAVEFRTHVLNLQSRRAIERLGAKLDGVLRAHSVMANGTIRDSAVYSITAPEWGTVKANLHWLLDKPRR